MVLIDFSKESHDYFQKAIEISKALDAQIIGFNVIDINTIHSLARHTDKRESEIAVDLEENGWKYLYILEDMAKEKGVHIVLQQVEGMLESAIIKAVSDYKIELLIIKRKLEYGIHSPTKFIEDILHKLTVPLLIF
jgi:nucleotide-binding universal stress UspA family protein